MTDETTGMEIKAGRFEWATRKENGTDFHHLSVGPVEVGFVASAVGGEGAGFDWTVYVGGEILGNDDALPTLDAAKGALAQVVRGIIANTPDNGIREFYRDGMNPSPYSHIDD